MFQSRHLAENGRRPGDRRRSITSTTYRFGTRSAAAREDQRKLAQEQLSPEAINDALAKELEALIRDRKQRDAA